MNKFYIHGFILLFLLGNAPLFAQNMVYKIDSTDSTMARDKRRLSGQVRYHFMATDNQQPLNNYFAHGLSMQGKFETGQWKGFHLAAGAAAIFNLSSSELGKNDPLANRPSRYEPGLFDLREPDKKAGFRPEELYLQYSSRKGYVRAGSQAINTPFVNPQDGRLRPTFISGIYIKQTYSSTQLEGGWIGGMLPRSINGWYSAGKSIGLNPQGINTDGTASDYAGRLSSKGIFLAGITHSVTPGIKVKFWEQFVHNIFYTALVQVDLEKKGKGKMEYLASLQYTHQFKVNEGGSNDLQKSYFQSNAAAQAISGMSGIRSEQFEASLNYTRIFKKSRFLMPREWGREPFFTFMPRERTEGFGDVQALVLKTSYHFPGAGLKTSLQMGRFLLPDVKDLALNKYGMPSYHQLNAEVRFTPAFAPKFDVQALYVYKWGSGNTYQNPGYVFNKVNLSHYNLVINYNW